MNMRNYFAALVSFDPSTPAKKSYQVIQVSKSRGETPEEIAESFADAAEAGFFFEAVDGVDASVIADTMLQHPADVEGMTYVPNEQLRERHAEPG